MTTDKRGVSALLLQRQLGLPRYETAWMMLHKFRRAMVSLTREPLRGEVEVDDTWVGGPQAGLRGSRQLKGRKAALSVCQLDLAHLRYSNLAHPLDNNLYRDRSEGAFEVHSKTGHSGSPQIRLPWRTSLLDFCKI